MEMALKPSSASGSFVAAKSTNFPMGAKNKKKSKTHATTSHPAKTQFQL